MIIRTITFLLMIMMSATSYASSYAQHKKDLLEGAVMAIAYSGFREGQHPDRGNGAVNPTKKEILEDLRILQKHGFTLLRMYDSKENSQTALELIKEHNLPLKIVLGVWLNAEISNHEGCPWLDRPIDSKILEANKITNKLEVKTAVMLANKYPHIVAAVNVGNEALVDWNDHMVTLKSITEYVRYVKRSISQPVTVADNYYWWATKGADLAKELDFIGVHTYPVWEHKTIEEGLEFTIENIAMVKKAIPNTPIVIMEAGWATTAIEFGKRASEMHQKTYYNQIKEWATQTNTTIFFFEAFDEPWKGNPAQPLGAEKHWGLFFVDRTPKQVVKESRLH